MMLKRFAVGLIWQVARENKVLFVASIWTAREHVTEVEQDLNESVAAFAHRIKR